MTRFYLVSGLAFSTLFQATAVSRLGRQGLRSSYPAFRERAENMFSPQRRRLNRHAYSVDDDIVQDSIENLGGKGCDADGSHEKSDCDIVGNTMLFTEHESGNASDEGEASDFIESSDFTDNENEDYLLDEVESNDEANDDYVFGDVNESKGTYIHADMPLDSKSGISNRNDDESLESIESYDVQGKLGNVDVNETIQTVETITTITTITTIETNKGVIDPSQTYMKEVIPLTPDEDTEDTISNDN